jgi:hypothetical protein
MSRLLCSGIAFAVAIACGVIGYTVGTTQAMKTMLESQDTMSIAQRSYLVGRFRAAYELQQPAVAIWEGTNLLSHLMQESPSPISKEELAQQLLLNARVSALFHEVGDRQEEQRYAERALALFSLLRTNSAITASEVVSNCLARDLLRRRPVGPHQ